MLFVDEEPNLPVVLTTGELKIWRKLRHGQDPRDPNELNCDGSLLYRTAEQHRQGLSYNMKRERRPKQPRESLAPKYNERLPKLLQEVETFNPELMSHQLTEVHCTMPDDKLIAKENQVVKMEGEKPWNRGVVLHQQESLVRDDWSKKHGDDVIMKRTRETMDRSSLIMVGVLQQWRQVNLSERVEVRSHPQSIMKDNKENTSSLTSPRPATRELDKINEEGEFPVVDNQSLRHASR